jgi:hypothetical protein
VLFSAKVGKRIGVKAGGYVRRTRRVEWLHGPASCEISQYAFRRTRADTRTFSTHPATAPAEVNRHRLFRERRQVFTALGRVSDRRRPYNPATAGMALKPRAIYA